MIADIGGTLVIVFGAVYVTAASARLGRKPAIPSRRQRAGVIAHGSMYVLVGSGVVLGEATASRWVLVTLALLGVVSFAMSLVLKGKEAWAAASAAERASPPD